MKELQKEIRRKRILGYTPVQIHKELILKNPQMKPLEIQELINETLKIKESQNDEWAALLRQDTLEILLELEDQVELSYELLAIQKEKRQLLKDFVGTKIEIEVPELKDSEVTERIREIYKIASNEELEEEEQLEDSDE